MITCEMIKDLLPTYAAGDCSDETRQTVDEHVVTCESCAMSLLAMMEPAVTVVISREQEPSDPGSIGESDEDHSIYEERSQEMTFKRGFKKIRNRWLLSILCVLLIIPLLGLGYLGYNETSGEGYAFSNLKGLKNVDTFMKCLQDGEYERAIEFFDIGSAYPELIQEEGYSYRYINDYRLIEIGGANYYTSITSTIISEILDSRNDFEPYKDPGTDAAFWAQVIIDDVWSSNESPIPEPAFDQAARIASESLNEEIVIVEYLSETPDSPYTYVRYYAQDGAVYYRPTKNGRLSEVNWMNAAVIPESLLPVYIHSINQEIDARRELPQEYQALGIERYTEMVKEKYFTEMNELSSDGMKIESYSIGKPYRRDYLLSPMDYSYDTNEPEKKYWLVDVAVLFSYEKDVVDAMMPMEDNQVFTFRIDGDYLSTNGTVWMVHSETSPGGVQESMIYYHVSVEPSPYLFEEDPNRYLFTENGMLESGYYTYVIHANSGEWGTE